MQRELIGQVLGNWRLVAPLGSSHCSDVYRASSQSHDVDQPATYVIKVVPHNAPAWATRMLENEREILTRVSHPHVISLLDAGQTRGRHYLVLPFLEGMLPPDGRTQGVDQRQWSRVAWVARQIVSGLRAIHEAGFSHGDLKPVHISVDRNLHVTLIDLGMAQHLHQSRQLNELGQVDCHSDAVGESHGQVPLQGSPPYMAPEVFLRQQPSSAAQDVYSLGCLLYHWFTGMRPFQARSLAAWRFAHVNLRPVQPTRWVPDLPADIEKLLVSMLAKQPQRRPDLDEIESVLVRLELMGFGAWLQPMLGTSAA